MSPFDLFQMPMTMARLALDSQTVIALRVMGAIGVVPARRGENQRMTSEKLPALIKAQTAAGQAMMAGKRPDEVLSAWQAPLSKRVRANRKRLMR